MLKLIRWYGSARLLGGATFVLTLWQIYAKQPSWQVGVSALLAFFWLWRSTRAGEEVMLWAILHALHKTTHPRSPIHIALSLGYATDVSTVERLLRELERRHLVESVADITPASKLYRTVYATIGASPDV